MYQNGTEFPEINHMFYNNKPTLKQKPGSRQTFIGSEHTTWYKLMSEFS